MEAVHSCILPSAKERASLPQGVAILNISVAAMLNPFIYTLRNQQVKQAFKNLVHASPLQEPPLPKKARTARPGREKSAYILRQSILVKLPGGRASWVLSGSAICSLPQGVPYSCRTAAQHRQPPARAPQPKNIRASSAQPSDLPPSWCRPPSPVCPQKVLLCFRETLSALPTLQKSHTASKKTDKQHQPSGNIPQQWQGKHCPATFSEYNSTRKKKTTSKIKKLRNHPQLNQQEISPKAVNNKTDLYSLTDLEFKRETVKILKELREDMNSNGDTLRKELENIRRSQEKWENSFAEIKTELRAVKTRMNNGEKWSSDVEDRIMEITQTGHRKPNEKTWKQYKRSMG